jgi:lysophospholipase L1-like esterase
VLLAAVLAAGAVVGVDLYLHKRYETAAGLNIRGYRGALVGRKRPGERRVVVLGGSAAFGYGVRAHEAFPAALERRLNDGRPQEDRGRVSVVNLAYNREGAYALLATLRDYESLDYDMALFYTGYNDLSEEPNLQIFRHESLAFKLTGYHPILPLVLKEKWMALRHGGNLEAAYKAQAVVFRPVVGQQGNAQRHNAAAGIRQALERRLGRLTRQDALIAPAAAECGDRWHHYCQSVAAAIEYALGRGKRVLVVTEPYVSDEHVTQQAEMANMLKARFGGERRMRYVNLGQGVVDLEDPNLCVDGIHLSLEGNERIAEALVEPVVELLDETDG